MRADRIGIGVRYDELAVVLVQRDGVSVASGVVKFMGHHPDYEDFNRAIDSVLLVDGKRRKVAGTTLHVAVGPNHSQLRRLEALPALRDAASLGVLLQENASSFFLKNGVPLRVSSATKPAQDGSSWAAAFDAPVIEAAVRAAEGNGFHQVTAVPVSIALSPSEQGRVVSRWHDGAVSIESEFQDGVIERVLRLAMEEVLPGTSAPGVAAADAFADAYGAVHQRGHSIRWETPSLWKERLRKARPWCAAVALLLAIGVLALGPSLQDLTVARRNEARLESLRSSVTGANQAEADLKKQSAALGRLTEFSKRRIGALEALAALTTALPDSTALVAFHVDSLAGSASIMGRDVMTALEEIQTSRDFVSVEITTPITREAVGSMELERVGIRFKLARKGRK